MPLTCFRKAETNLKRLQAIGPTFFHTFRTTFIIETCSFFYPCKFKETDMPEETLIFRPMKLEESDIVAEMIKTLYRTLKAPAEYMTDKKIAATFKQLQLQPESLEMDVFEINKTIVGYALLFKFWYNEYGGMVLNIDELFVDPDFQSRGIASLYLSELSKKRDDYVALSLEVLPENKGAYSLYKRIGFQEKETITLHKLLE
jgi:ribosomal protein S18 acetylase RimI-like enzyme